MTTSLRRGTGPWPSNNTESVVSGWLRERMNGVESSERDAMARWLLDHHSGQPKGQRLVHDYRWHESKLDALAACAQRLNDGEPLQHVLGLAWFDGLPLEVSPCVLIPRPETEELVNAMCSQLLKETTKNPLVVDWCTGSGCVALAVKNRIPGAVVSGWDVSPKAIEVARTNSRRCQLDVAFGVADVLAPISPQVSADAVLSNPPYIPQSESSSLHPRVTQHEPGLALFVPDDDPLVFYRATERWCAKGGLRPGGWLGFECHAERASEVAALLESAGGWQHVNILSDLQGMPRHVLAQRELP